MTEQELWRCIERAAWAAGPGVHIVRVENSLEWGFPDLDFCIAGYAGKLELKANRAWPKNPDAIVPCRGFTPQQRLWLARRVIAGGAVGLLWVIGWDILLFTEDFGCIGTSTRDALYQSAAWSASRRRSKQGWAYQLLDVLSDMREAK